MGVVCALSLFLLSSLPLLTLPPTFLRENQEVGDIDNSTSEGGRYNDSYDTTTSKHDPSPAPAPTSTKKSSQSTKLVDLGAAAAFASNAAAENKRRETAGTTIDSVFGDFSSGQTVPSQPPPPAVTGKLPPLSTLLRHAVT